MSTPQHCPGFEQFRNLKSILCNCPSCGKEIEIFSDEFDKKHVCRNCHKEVDFGKCSVKTSGSTDQPR